MVSADDYYSLTLIVWDMNVKLKMFMKIVRIKKCLILVFIPLSQGITMIKTN